MDHTQSPATAASAPGLIEAMPLGDFGSTSENLVLRERIRARIAAAGPMRFREFIQSALYDPDEGYYNTRPAIGRRGDYLTSPELHPLFGVLIARQLRQFWQLLGSPAEFRLIEAGAGTGALARAILSQAPPDLRERLRYVIVEPSPARAAQQRATLGGLAGACVWAPLLGETLAVNADCVLSNELLDSFPVYRALVRDGRLIEVLVDVEGEGFVDQPVEPAGAELDAYFSRLGLLPGEGCHAEINLDCLDWAQRCASAIDRGFALTLDYGYPARNLYASWRRQGTLLSFYQHTVGTDPYVHVGLQDLTSHVDFTSFARAAAAAGLVVAGYTTQQHFLNDLGIADALAGGPAAAPSLEEYLSRRRAVEALLDPQGLGRIRVLAQAKGVDADALIGFRSGPEALT